MTISKTKEGLVAKCDQGDCAERIGPMDLLTKIFEGKIRMANWETSKNRKVHMCKHHRRTPMVR